MFLSDDPVLRKLKAGIIRKQSNFRDVFGRKMNLFNGEKDKYTEIPKLRREKNFPKKLQDLKTDLNTNLGGQKRTSRMNSGDEATILGESSGDLTGLEDQSDLSEEVFIDLQNLLG